VLGEEFEFSLSKITTYQKVLSNLQSYESAKYLFIQVFRLESNPMLVQVFRLESNPMLVQVFRLESNPMLVQVFRLECNICLAPDKRVEFGSHNKEDLHILMSY